MKEEDVTRYIAERIADVLSDAYEEFGRIGQTPKVNPELPAGGIAAVSKMDEEELLKVRATFVASEKDDE